MSATTPGGSQVGAVISIKEIHDTLVKTNLELQQLKSTIKLASFLIAPAISTACAIVLPPLLKG